VLLNQGTSSDIMEWEIRNEHHILVRNIQRKMPLEVPAHLRGHNIEINSRYEMDRIQ
jgi:hypothetical protein